MNRYLAAGAAQDARAGRRVVVLSGDRRASDEAARHVESLAPDAVKVRRSHGDRAVHFPNGSVLFRSRLQNIRGHAFDVAVLDGFDLTPDELLELAPALNRGDPGDIVGGLR